MLPVELMLYYAETMTRLHQRAAVLFCIAVPKFLFQLSDDGL